MKKLQVKEPNGAWAWVFCRNANRGGCITTPNKRTALPQKSCWAQSDIAYFRNWFADREFRLAATLNEGETP